MRTSPLVGEMKPKTQIKTNKVINLIEKIWRRYMPNYFIYLTSDLQLMPILINGSIDEFPKALVKLELKRSKEEHGKVTQVGNAFFRLMIHYDRTGDDLIRTVAHELRHIQQFIEGHEFNFDLPWAERPHEIDAHKFSLLVADTEKTMRDIRSANLKKWTRKLSCPTK